MRLVTAFFRLIRWPNLLFIALTQLLFYYCIIVPSLPVHYYQLNAKLTPALLYLLVAASVFIAAAGYIINDYFDINIDQVNKPDAAPVFGKPIQHALLIVARTTTRANKKRRTRSPAHMCA